MKQTLLNKWHKEHGARMAEFGGYEMPLWYEKGVKSEHLAVIQSVGLFDTSHMAMVKVYGQNSRDLLQLTHSKDLNSCIGKSKAAISNGRCVYGVFMNEKAHVIDDAIIYQITENSYLVCVNASMGKAVAEHLDAHKGNFDAEVHDLTDQLGKLDIQGPNSAKLLKKILENSEQLLEMFPYFSFKGNFETELESEVVFKGGIKVLLSRTGYTGEFGFELFCRSQDFIALWELVYEAGNDLGLEVCALAARDSLRAGAVLPLSHQDIGHWPFINHPWPFALAYNESNDSFTKDFIGKDALQDLSQPEWTFAFHGDNLRKVSPESEVYLEDELIGVVLTCASDMALGMIEGKIYSISSPDKPENFKAKGISCGFVKLNKKLNIGDRISLKEGKKEISVTLTEDIRPHRTARKAISKMI